LAVALFAAAAVFAFTVPVRADEHPAQAKRTTTSFQAAQPATLGTSAAGHPGSTNGFLVFPDAQGMNIGGRVNVGKSHVYVPYYGVISNDPAHPGVQGTAGLAYGFRTWDISVLNGAFGTTQPAIPGTDVSKVNPALTFSLHF